MTQAKKNNKAETASEPKERTSLYLKKETNKVIKYIAFISGKSQTEIIDNAITDYQKKWEAENGAIPSKFLK